ncbi:MAG: sensor histidine kinase [Paracoccaceae bacterium]
MSGYARTWSLRQRLTWRVLGLVIIGWCATIGFSAWVLNHEMNEMFDEELHALVETTALLVETSETGAIPRQLGIETRDGERVLRLLSDTANEPTAPWPSLTKDGFHDSSGWRILRATVEGTVIEAAHAVDWRRTEMLEAASAFLILVLPLAGLLLWGLRRITAEATAPIAGLAGAVAARRADDYSPVLAASLPRELLPLADAYNAHLSRIDAFRRSEQDFIANAAHELRTPLAMIRGRLELSTDPDASAAVPMIDALTRRVERLLQMSRIEAGVGLGTGPADAVRILRLLLDEMRGQNGHPVRFDDSDMDRLMVMVDPDALAILLRNLLENATEHGSGVVNVRLKGDGTLTIRNPTTVASLDLERFGKGEASGGLGIGLSISRAVCLAMQIPLSIDITAGEARFMLALPVVPG